MNLANRGIPEKQVHITWISKSPYKNIRLHLRSTMGHTMDNCV